MKASAWAAARRLLGGDEPRRAIWVAFAVGLVVRLAFVLFEPATRRVGDEGLWVGLARHWVAEQGFNPLRSSLIFNPPLFPYLLGAIDAFLGGLESVKLAQALAGALLVPAVGLAGVRLFGPRAGVLAAFLVAFYPELVWYSAHFWAEPLFMALLWWSIAWLLRTDAEARVGGALAGGLLCGLAALTRETALYFAPLAAVWLGVGRRPGAWRRAGVFLLGTVLVVAPWTVRNWVVFDAFVPVSLMGGRALWEGNTDLSRGEVYARYDAVAGPIERDRLARREAERNILSRQPAWFFEKLFAQAPRFFAADDFVVVHMKRGAYGPVPPPVAWAVAALTLLPYLAALVLFGGGLPRLPPTRPQVLLLTFVGYYFLIHVVVHAFPRYRLPVVPAILLVAANTYLARREPWPSPAGQRRLLAALLVILLAVWALPVMGDHLAHPLFGLVEGPGE